MQKEAEIRDPLILGNKSFHDITKDIAKPVEGKANKYWWILFSLSLVLFIWGVLCMAYTIGVFLLQIQWCLILCVYILWKQILNLGAF